MPGLIQVAEMACISWLTPCVHVYAHVHARVSISVHTCMCVLACVLHRTEDVGAYSTICRGRGCENYIKQEPNND